MQTVTPPTYNPADTDVLDALATGVVVLDADQRVLHINAAAERLLRTTSAQLCGRGLVSTLRDATALVTLCSRSLAENRTLVLRKFDIHPANSLAAVRQIDAVASVSADGALVLELHDNEVQHEIEKENQLLEQHGVGRTMAAQLAHEIKNPLGGLRGAAQLLAKRLDDKTLNTFTDVIIRESDRLNALVDTMLGPAGPTVYENVNIHRLAQHVMRLIEAEAGSRVNIVEDYDPSLPPISIDEDRIIQALLNVARNALQAIDGKGTLTLRTRAVNGFTIVDRRHSLVLRLDVIDTGPGIADVLKERLFFPLVTSRSEGTGLGLTVAQDLVSRHGGLIKVTGSAPTVFSIYLPYLRRGAEHGDTT